mmetsp:Transcript_4798/g.10895  ORF Transcript_4798/g.10895 Transcript_4798/m.10895 type:complete len:200 (+) Transcript_4798:114-713(+)
MQIGRDGSARLAPRLPATRRCCRELARGEARPAGTHPCLRHFEGGLYVGAACGLPAPSPRLRSASALRKRALHRSSPGLSACARPRALASPALQHFEDQLYVVAAHLFERRSLGDGVEVPQDEVHATLPKAMCDVHVCSLQNGGGAIDVDGDQDLLLAQPLQSLHAELVGCDEEVHGDVESDLHLVSVEVFQQHQEDSV